MSAEDELDFNEEIAAMELNQNSLSRSISPTHNNLEISSKNSSNPPSLPTEITDATETKRTSSG